MRLTTDNVSRNLTRDKRVVPMNMLALHETLRMPSDHILHLRIPNIPHGQEVEVLVLAKDNDSYAAKIALIAEAAQDPLYQKDMDEIADDFTFVDSEHL